jgi:hypothetical protein
VSNRHKEEILMAARKAAVEAMGRERSRCLWILDRLLQQCSKDIDSKVLPAAQMQLVRLRFEMTKSIVQAARMLILNGTRPPVATATPAPGQGEPPPSPPSEIVTP